MQKMYGNSTPQVLVEKNINSIEGLALDWMSRNLYFVDGENKKIEMIRTDNYTYHYMRKSVLSAPNLIKPRGLAVHPERG